jgi:hypothetical protein
MSKNRNKGNKDKDSPAEAGTATPRSRKPQAPRGPLPERLCLKADKIYSMVTEISKSLITRGAPKDTSDAASAFVVQVEGWREKLFALKNSGWEPATKAGKAPIVEGDPIEIVAEHQSRYAFIEGLVDGTTKLVAGAVVQVSRLQVEIMLKDTNGKFYGYAPRRFVARR